MKNMRFRSRKVSVKNYGEDTSLIKDELILLYCVSSF